MRRITRNPNGRGFRFAPEYVAQQGGAIIGQPAQPKPHYDPDALLRRFGPGVVAAAAAVAATRSPKTEG